MYVYSLENVLVSVFKELLFSKKNIYIYIYIYNKLGTIFLSLSYDPAWDWTLVSQAISGHPTQRNCDLNKKSVFWVDFVSKLLKVSMIY